MLRPIVKCKAEKQERQQYGSFFLFHHSILLVLLLSPSTVSLLSIQNSFLQCLSRNSNNSISFSTTSYTLNNPSFTTILHSTSQNLRFTLPSVPRPEFIFPPLHC
ncbi:hypothetical protein NC651_027639 [Populus alba x Populus x berolinensis]|nr:hypothetical protein NC651_027639 [Populus alba x Populus x berolinensis]